MFQLDVRLAKDTLTLVSWPLCDVQLMNDSQFPWLILVPRVEGVTELYHLDKAQREQLDAESILLGETLMSLFKGDKLNVAALGNVVSQLHIHHVVRYKRDLVWPAPVWGKCSAKAYSGLELEALTLKLSALINHVW